MTREKANTVAAKLRADLTAARKKIRHLNKVIAVAEEKSPSAHARRMHLRTNAKNQKLRNLLALYSTLEIVPSAHNKPIIREIRKLTRDHRKKETTPSCTRPKAAFAK